METTKNAPPKRTAGGSFLPRNRDKEDKKLPTTGTRATKRTAARAVMKTVNALQNKTPEYGPKLPKGDMKLSASEPPYKKARIAAPKSRNSLRKGRFKDNEEDMKLPARDLSAKNARVEPMQTRDALRMSCAISGSLADDEDDEDTKLPASNPPAKKQKPNVFIISSDDDDDDYVGRRTRRQSTLLGNQAKREQEQRDEALAASLQLEEEGEREKHMQKEHDSMVKGIAGRSVLVVENVIHLMQPHLVSGIEPVGKDDAVYLAEHMFELQARELQEGK